MATFAQPGLPEDYRINTSVYEGPLDLLLSLIEKAELDITSLALAQITDQYLDYLEKLEYKDPTEISYFLVVAARLIQIKSEALLPTPPLREVGEEDPGETLAQQLLLYKKFKEIAHYLQNRDEQRLTTALHIAPDYRIEGILDLTGITADDLADAARSILISSHDPTFGDKVITLPQVTIREKIGMIISSIREKGTISFSSILTNRHDKLELVVTFLALLELVKQHLILTQQDDLFSEIIIQSGGEVEEPAEYSLEFGE